MTNKIPNPGSDEAVSQGCLCPVMDNRRGAGTPDGHFWVNGSCPLHGIAAQEKYDRGEIGEGC